RLIPSSPHNVSSASRSLAPTRVTSVTSAPSFAAVAAPYSAEPPRRHRPSGNSSRDACPIARNDVLDIEEDVHGIAVLDHIGLALGPEERLLPRVRLAAGLQQVIPPDHLRANEATLEVRVDRPCRLLRRRAFEDRPRAHLVLAGGEEGGQADDVVRRVHDPLERRLG